MVNMCYFNDVIYAFRYSRYQSNFHTDIDDKSQSGIKLIAQSSLLNLNHWDFSKVNLFL